MQKRQLERARRLKYYSCAIELISETRSAPETTIKNHIKHINYHRFEGVSRNGVIFFVQVKENTKTGRKDFMSVFPKK
jgi:hypothetical protein